MRTWLRAHRLHIALSALAFYILAIPLTLVIFPDNNIWLALLIICASLVQSILAVADLLD